MVCIVIGIAHNGKMQFSSIFAVICIQSNFQVIPLSTFLHIEILYWITGNWRTRGRVRERNKKTNAVREEWTKDRVVYTLGFQNVANTKNAAPVRYALQCCTNRGDMPIAKATQLAPLTTAINGIYNAHRYSNRQANEKKWLQFLFSCSIHSIYLFVRICTALRLPLIICTPISYSSQCLHNVSLYSVVRLKTTLLSAAAVAATLFYSSFIFVRILSHNLFLQHLINEDVNY